MTHPGHMGRRADLLLRTSLIGLLIAVLAGMAIWFVGSRSAYSTGVGWVVEQPVPFSHQHHVAGLGIDCRFCHTSVTLAATPGMPATDTCMTCHSQIWTNAALLAPVRASLANGTPIRWNKLNDLPDYVYFNHAIHIAKGVGCSSCHGAVDRMPLMTKAQSFTMQFCISCHRNPGPQLRPQDAIFDTEWHQPADPQRAQQLVDLYHLGGRNLTDCSVCHR